MATEPEFGRYLPPRPVPTMDTFRWVLERCHALERDRGHAVWAIAAKESGIVVGQCVVQPVEDTAEVELAYHLSQARWNQGYATEAATAVLAYVLGGVGLERVIALEMPENVASAASSRTRDLRSMHSTPLRVTGSPTAVCSCSS